MDRPLGLVEEQLIGTTHKHRDAAKTSGWLREASHSNNGSKIRAELFLPDKFCVAKFIRCEALDGGARLDTDDLGNELDISAFNVSDNHDLLLGAEVEGQVCGGIAQNGLLDQQHVASSLGNLLDHLRQDGSLLAKQSIHLRVVANLNIALHVCLWGRQAELDETNLSIRDACWAASYPCNLLGKHKAVNHLGLINGGAEFLHQPDVF